MQKAMQSLQLASRSQVFESEDKIVIGLDFGTTFSGIAYAFANEKKPELVSIMDWPGRVKRFPRKYEI